jgi:ribosomal protein L11 methyltransferase
MENLNLKGKAILDIGTGTGILSMFALKLGASRAVFTEIDPCAIPCLSENFAVNDCANATGFLGGLECLEGKGIFDCIVCNMIRSEVWPLRKDIERLLCKDGYFVLSGQLLVDKHYVTDWFAQSGFTIHEEIVRGEWWSVCARKTN